MLNRCIIIASGASVKSGITLGLWNQIKGEITFGINEAIKFNDCTAYTFGDWYAYRDRFDLYKEKELVIGRYDTHFTHKIEGALPCPKQDGLILLQGSSKWHGEEGLSKGLYSGVLTGAFTLNLALRLGFKQIFLLGFDCGATGTSTHWYDAVEGAGQYTDYEGKPTCGVGKDENGNYRTGVYNKDDVQLNLIWEPFSTESAMIYNVSLDSRISVFPKIGYQAMFKILKENPIEVNQESVQKEIRTLLTQFNKA